MPSRRPRVPADGRLGRIEFRVESMFFLFSFSRRLRRFFFPVSGSSCSRQTWPQNREARAIFHSQTNIPPFSSCSLPRRFRLRTRTLRPCSPAPFALAPAATRSENVVFRWGGGARRSRFAGGGLFGNNQSTALPHAVRVVRKGGGSPYGRHRRAFYVRRLRLLITLP